MQETSLHAALKDWYTISDHERQEVPVDGFQIDVVSGELLIEIQTRHFDHLKEKLPALLEKHPLLLVYPIPLEKWIVRLPQGQAGVLKRRKSPSRGRLVQLFYELVRIPNLIAHPNLAIEVLLIREEEIRRQDGRGSWRRQGWSIADRRLIEVVQAVRLENPQDFRVFLPASLPDPFTSRDLSTALDVPLNLANKVAYCLRSMGLITLQGRRGNAYLYSPI